MAPYFLEKWMSIFSTKKKHYVDTTVMRVVEDNLVPSALISAIHTTLFTDGDIVDSVLDAALNGSFRNFERMYRWAARTDPAGEPNYFYGLPDAKVITTSDGFEKAKAAIELELREPIELDYLHFRPINNIHAGFQYVREDWGWDPKTNELKVLTAVFGGGDPDAVPPVLPIKIYLEKMVAVHRAEPGLEPDASTVGTYGESASAGYTEDRAVLDISTGLSGLVAEQDIRIGPDETESVEIYYTFRDRQGVTQHGTYVLDLSHYDDVELYQARYTYGSPEQMGFWIYDARTDVHKALTGLFEVNFTDPGTYFPFAFIRSDDQEMTADSKMNTEQFKSTEKLLDYIGINYKDMGDSIHENEDVNSIDQAALIMGVPITSTNQVELEYLCDYFADVYNKVPEPAKHDGARALDLKSRTKLNATPDESYAVTIEDADFRMVLSFDWITKKYETFVIDPEDFVEFTNTLEEVADLTLPGSLVVSGTRATTTRVFTRQITDTVREVIRVGNPRVRYDIYKNKGAEGTAEDDRLLIPLDYNISRGINLLKREELYYRSLHLVFNSHVVQKTKWYEKKWFKFVLVAVAVVVTVISLGQTWQSIVVAAGVGATTTALVVAFLQSLVLGFLKGMVFQFAFTEFAKVVGFDITLAVAAALAVYGGFKLSMASTTVAKSSAMNLLGASTMLAKGGQAELGEEFKDLKSDMDDFVLLQEEAAAELERGQELLGMSNHSLDPFVFIGLEPMTMFGEAPSGYFDRAVHAGNVGTESVKIVQNFVDISLKLPTVTETVGEIFDGGL
jgi:hypothetical protein